MIVNNIIICFECREKLVSLKFIVILDGVDSDMEDKYDV